MEVSDILEMRFKRILTKLLQLAVLQLFIKKAAFHMLHLGLLNTLMIRLEVKDLIGAREVRKKIDLK